MSNNTTVTRQRNAAGQFVKSTIAAVVEAEPVVPVPVTVPRRKASKKAAPKKAGRQPVPVKIPAGLTIEQAKANLTVKRRAYVQAQRTVGEDKIPLRVRIAYETAQRRVEALNGHRPYVIV